MPDGRKNNGGRREGAGRKPKADEIKLIEKLDKHIDQDSVIKKMKELIDDDNFQALKLYLEYRWGKPKESVDITSGNEALQGINLSSLSDKELAILAKLHARNLSDTDL